jgi:hypothetical protein
MCAEIVPLFDPKARYYPKQEAGRGIGAGPRFSDAEIDRLALQWQLTMRLSYSDNSLLKLILGEGALSARDTATLFDDRNTMIATATIVRDRLIAATATRRKRGRKTDG